MGVNIIGILRVWLPEDCNLGGGIFFLKAGELGNQKVFFLIFFYPGASISYCYNTLDRVHKVKCFEIPFFN